METNNDFGLKQEVGVGMATRWSAVRRLSLLAFRQSRSSHIYTTGPIRAAAHQVEKQRIQMCLSIVEENGGVFCFFLR